MGVELVSLEAEVAPQTVRELIEARARRWREANYLVAIENGHALNSHELLESCRSVTALLHSLGAVAGDHVSLVMGNGLQTVRILLGAMAGGFCVNPVNLLSQPDQMRYVLDHSDCRIVFVAPDREELVRTLVKDIAREINVVVVDPDGALIEGERSAVPEFETSAPSPDALALLMYTSGTTGKPKGVMLTHRNLAANATAISQEHRLGVEDRVLAVLPLYHINAFAVTMLAPLAHGGSLALPAKFSAARFWDWVVDYRCTWINVVPTIISYLLEGAVPARASLSAVKFCRSASAALPPAHHRLFEEKFGIGIIETMGLTETVAPAFSNPHEAHARKIGSVGRASGCEARVCDAEGNVLPAGVSGEIGIRGPNVMRGYYKHQEASTAAFHADQWLRTGDLGHVDEDGFFFVTGRLKELIIKGGENIAPREIDEALLKHPQILDAASVGIPDPHYGQEIMVCVVLREGAALSEAELRDFCLTHLGRYKTPKLIRFVTDLPRGPSGKVQRLKLLETLAS